MLQEEGVLPPFPLGMGSAVGALGEAGNGAKTPRIPVCFPEALPVPVPLRAAFPVRAFAKNRQGRPGKR